MRDRAMTGVRSSQAEQLASAASAAALERDQIVSFLQYE